MNNIIESVRQHDINNLNNLDYQLLNNNFKKEEKTNQNETSSINDYKISGFSNNLDKEINKLYEINDSELINSYYNINEKEELNQFLKIISNIYIENFELIYRKIKLDSEDLVKDKKLFFFEYIYFIRNFLKNKNLFKEIKDECLNNNDLFNVNEKNILNDLLDKDEKYFDNFISEEINEFILN